MEAWGVEATLKKVVGMLAMALWDRQTRTLTLARDRMGEKPLYYGWAGKVLLFGSELKALREHPAFTNPINRASLKLFMRFAYIPQPWSIFEGIWKLPSGSYVQFHLNSTPFPQGRKETGNCLPEGRGDVKAYWSLREVAERGLDAPFLGSDSQAVEALEALLKQSIRGQMLADVPLGAFLSGGVDSSTVVALMQELSLRPVQTFTIGFHETEYNEARYASAVAAHIGTDHTELYVTPREAMDVIPQLSRLYDEPFADSSQIPTHLVCQLARRHVTVALSGDGGDELFVGYNRYFLASRIWRRIRLLPSPIRRLGASLIQMVPPEAWNRMLNVGRRLFPQRLFMQLSGDKLHKLAGLLDIEVETAIYQYFVSYWPTEEAIMLGIEEPITPVNDMAQWLDCMDFEHRMMYLDAITYLPDDILVKVDRAAMAISLETRVPLLDHRVVEFVWSLPLSMKIQAGQGKRLLRHILYKYVPQTLIERPKMGFGVPISQWLRKPLKNWAEDLLSEQRLRRESLLNPVPIRRKWQEHLSGRRNWAHLLWNVLMFEEWMDAAN